MSRPIAFLHFSLLYSEQHLCPPLACAEAPPTLESIMAQSGTSGGARNCLTASWDSCCGILEDGRQCDQLESL